LYSLPPEQIRPGEVPDQEGGVLPQETRNHSCWVYKGLVVKTQEQIQQRISFLQRQLDSLEHYLPETYQFLMAEMDHQQCNLMELRIQDFYEDLSNEHQN
jgi:hypothetical protein